MTVCNTGNLSSDFGHFCINFREKCLHVFVIRALFCKNSTFLKICSVSFNWIHLISNASKTWFYYLSNVSVLENEQKRLKLDVRTSSSIYILFCVEHLALSSIHRCKSPYRKKARKIDSFLSECNTGVHLMDTVTAFLVNMVCYCSSI